MSIHKLTIELWADRASISPSNGVKRYPKEYLVYAEGVDVADLVVGRDKSELIMIIDAALAELHGKGFPAKEQS